MKNLESLVGILKILSAFEDSLLRVKVLGFRRCWQILPRIWGKAVPFGLTLKTAALPDKDADPEVNSYSTRGWETPIGKTFVFGIELTL